MKHPIAYYFFWSFPILMAMFAILSMTLLYWVEFFGVPCWAFDGGTINDTITREAIERCGK